MGLWLGNHSSKSQSLAICHCTLKSQCGIPLSCLRHREISGVRDGNRNRKLQKSCNSGAPYSVGSNLVTLALPEPQLPRLWQKLLRYKQEEQDDTNRRLTAMQMGDLVKKLSVLIEKLRDKKTLQYIMERFCTILLVVVLVGVSKGPLIVKRWKASG